MKALREVSTAAFAVGSPTTEVPRKVLRTGSVS